MTDDDWAPLPEDRRVHHPGEFADPAARPPAVVHVAPPVGPAAAPAPAPCRVSPVPNPAAERALAELRARLANTKPGTSFVAESQRRQRREELREKRALAAAMAEAAARPAHDWDAAEPIATAPLEAPPAHAVPAAAGEPDVDARESEPWFQALPPGERERLRAHWWQQRHRHDDEVPRRHRRILRAGGIGAGVFFVLAVLQSPWFGSFEPVLRLAAAGGVALGVAEATGGGRFRYGVAGAAAFVAAMGSSLFTNPSLLFSLSLMVYVSAILGMEREMLRSGGFRAD
ncbi:MAG: hypothetical protein JNK78_18770 [Planctomycetes bacterium]|nr:hypothetical protein [Planctomycetota bacterium]